jgi:hypothetical protein
MANKTICVYTNDAVKGFTVLVIFHRQNESAGRAIRFNIEQDGRPIGQLLAGSTLEVPLAPGAYTFTVRVPSLDGMDYLTLNIEAGKTYRVQGEVLWGWPAGRPRFGNVSESGVATQPASTTPANVPSSPAAPSATPAAAIERQGISANEAGRLGLRNFAGEWNLETWSLTLDGRKLEGSGVAVGTIEGGNATRIVITQFESEDFPAATGGGRVTISLESGSGFVMETEFQYSDEVLKLRGGFQPDSNKYVFYLIGAAEGQTATGINRASVRLEIRSLDLNSWIAETFAHVDGQSTRVHSSRFTRR